MYGDNVSDEIYFNLTMARGPSKVRPGPCFPPRCGFDGCQCETRTCRTELHEVSVLGWCWRLHWESWGPELVRHKLSARGVSPVLINWEDVPSSLRDDRVANKYRLSIPVSLTPSNEHLANWPTLHWARQPRRSRHKPWVDSNASILVSDPGSLFFPFA